MKRIFVIAILVLALGAGMAVAGPAEFSKGNIFLTPQFGFASWGGSIPFGLSAEFAVTENIGIGGTVMAQLWSEAYWSESLIGLSVEAYYHFIKLNASKFDLFAGAGLGYSIYSWSWKSGYNTMLTGSSGSSGLILEPILGARYYVSRNIALSLKLVGSLVGGYTGFGAVGGVTFKLK
jgi:hypothetical protein